MIGWLAATTGIPPSVLWEQEPRDLATLLRVVGEMAERRG